MFANKLKIGLILAVDIAGFYLSLLLALFLRYGSTELKTSFSTHLLPFSILLLAWIFIFYLFDLYSPRAFKNKIELLSLLSSAVLVSFLLSIAAFYAFGSVFKLAPKINLIIFTIIFSLIGLIFRMALGRIFALKKFAAKVLLIGDGENMSQAAEAIGSNPQFGYKIESWIKGPLDNQKIKELIELVKNSGVSLVVIGRDAKKDPLAVGLAYSLIPLHVEIIDFPNFYESIFRKVPLGDLGEEWFIEEIKTRKKAYDLIKRFIDIVMSIALIAAFAPLALIIAVLIIFTSPGRLIYSQTRVGRSGREFTLYKFRTMKKDAEKNGAKWAEESDPRITPIGRFLRFTHLDEMPQLWNILKSDLSFVGPRPERPEFTKLLKEQIPHYEMRHTIKPGLTGWAQISYRYGSSVRDAREKLQHELYYHKYRSIIFDLIIILKTIRLFFSKNS